MGSLAVKGFNVKKVAIIGAGPCGLSAAKYLRAQGSFEKITIFEQQDEVGGIWNYNPLKPGPYPAPQEDPFFPPDKPIQQRPEATPVFPSPMYEKLHANIPGTLMKFSDKAFPQDAWIFPSRETIQQYLVEYAEELRELIRFCRQVTRVSLRPQDGHDEWEVEAQSTVANESTKETFDAVVVTNGHYSVPYIPNTTNIREFQNAFSEALSHSKHYRTPDPFKDKKVVIVGNGPSGIDIALQINSVCKQPGLLSVRHPTPAERLAYIGCEEVAEIDEFLVGQRGIRFKDGRVETDIDAVVFCTGFLFNYSFLPDLEHEMITVGRGVHGLYKHLFSIEHPTLVFPGLNMKAIPWPLSEAQAALFSVVWSNNLPLPPREAMKDWSKALYEKCGEALHIFDPLEDGLYLNELHRWVQKAAHLGKEPPYWNDELLWQRTIYGEAKLLFELQGCKARSLEELGLHYDPEKADQLHEIQAHAVGSNSNQSEAHEEI